MSFATPLPVWATLVAVAAAAWLAWHAYRGAALPRHARAVLSTLRFVTLLVLLVCLMRPVARSTDADARDAVVAILVDGSRSMSIADVNGERRIDRARAILRDEVMPRVRAAFHADVLRFGDQLAAADERTLSATDSRTRLGRALAGVRDRYRGRAVAGIILLSDGGDSGGEDAAAAASGGAPIYAIGVGSPSVERDREILSVTAAESVLSDAVVDVAVSAVSHGYGRAPIELRLLENGRSIDVRRAAPAGDGIPVREVFRVSPNREVPTVYTVETPAGLIRSTFGQSNERILPLLLPPGRIPTGREVESLSEEKEARYREAARGRVRPLRGVERLLAWLGREGIPAAVGTSGPPENIRFLLEEFGWRSVFRALVDRSQFAASKPASILAPT